MIQVTFGDTPDHAEEGDTSSATGNPAAGPPIVIAKTPIVIRHQGLGRVSDAEAMELIGSLSGLAGFPSDQEVDTAQFEADVEGGGWAGSHGYLWRRASEIRALMANIPNGRVLYLGAMPEVPHAIAFGAYLGDEFLIEPYDSHRDVQPGVNRWRWPSGEETLQLESIGVPKEHSNAAGPAVIRLELSFSVDDEHVRSFVGPNDIANIRIRPAGENPEKGTRVRSPADVNVVRLAVRAALAATMEYRPNIDTIHFFAAAPVSACFVTGQELNLRNMPAVQTYRFRRVDNVPTTRPAIRLTAAGPSREELPLSEAERAEAARLRTELWEAALREVESYAAVKHADTTGDVGRWYGRLVLGPDLARLRPFPLLPPVYEVIDEKESVDPDPMDPPNYYGYQRGDRRWRVNDQFLLSLLRAFGGDEAATRTLVRLFLFHESIHKAHGITKARVEEVGKFANALETVDYAADLFAILHELDRAAQEQPGITGDFRELQRHTAYLIDLVIRSFWAFEDSPPIERMEIRRLRRYLNWYWQRERVERCGTSLQMAAVLARKPVVEIAGLEPSVESRRYYGYLRRFDPFVGLEIAIILDNEELKRIPTSVTVPIEKLMEAFSLHDHEQIKQGFRQIFDEAETSKYALPREEDIV